MEIGQKVYSHRTHVRDLVVVKMEGNNVICSGEVYHEYEKNYVTGWHKDDSIQFHRWSIRTKPYNDNAPILHKKDKWKDKISRNPNMCSRISYVYEDVLSGELNLNPFYQRDLVWTLEQKQAYILALFEEKATISPTFILNASNLKRNCGRTEVLDGKQRLTTVFDFIENRFPLQNGMYFKDLSAEDTRYFLSIDVRYTRIEKWSYESLTDNEKIELFLEINELGTKVDQKHMDKVKELIK